MEHSVIKAIHILSAFSAFAFFVCRAYPVLVQDMWQSVSSWKYKALVASQHSSYTVLMATGVWLLWNKNFVVQPWFYGKIALFVLIILASAIGFKRRVDWSIAVRKKALLVAGFAFVAVACLIAIKPQFGI